MDAGGDTAVDATLDSLKVASNEKDPALIFRVGKQRDRQPGERSRLLNLTSFQKGGLCLTWDGKVDNWLRRVDGEAVTPGQIVKTRQKHAGKRWRMFK